MTRALSALGDSALLLPASLLFLGYLAALRQGRLALAWVAALALGGGATVLAKLAFRACGANLTDFDVVSPSGHASFAALFYGALAVTVAAGRAPAIRMAVAAAAAVLVLLVGASRVRIGAHSGEEVVLGLIIGAVALAVYAVLHRRAGRPRLSPYPLVIGFAAVLALLGGRHFTLEHRIAEAAKRLASALDVCGPAPSTGLNGLPSSTFRLTAVRVPGELHHASR